MLSPITIGMFGLVAAVVSGIGFDVWRKSKAKKAIAGIPPTTNQ